MIFLSGKLEKIQKAVFINEKILFFTKRVQFKKKKHGDQKKK